MRNKLIAAGVGLFGYGALLGWAITGDFMEKRSREHSDTLTDIITRQATQLQQAEEFFQAIPMTEDELVAIRDGINEDREDVVVSDSTTADIPIEVEQPTGVGTTASGRTAYSDTDDVVNPPFPPGESPAETARKLRETISHYTSDDEAHDFESRVLAVAESDLKPPYVIPQEEFAKEVDDEGEKYDKTVVTYYPIQRVIVNDEEEVEDDVASLIGWQALSSFGADNNGDPDVVYVRNERMRTDFEVVRDDLNKPPLHVIYGMEKARFQRDRAAGVIRVRDEDL